MAHVSLFAYESWPGVGSRAGLQLRDLLLIRAVSSRPFRLLKYISAISPDPNTTITRAAKLMTTLPYGGIAGVVRQICRQYQIEATRRAASMTMRNHWDLLRISAPY